MSGSVESNRTSKRNTKNPPFRCKKRKVVHAIRVTDLDEEPVKSNSINVEEEICNLVTTPNSLGTVIELALSSNEAIEFDHTGLHDAFLNFFEKGEVSSDLDSYFTKLLVTEGLESSNASVSRVSSKSISRPSKDRPSKQRSIDIAKYRQIRLRNNEACRRSRATNKVFLQQLAQSVKRMEHEQRAMLIWLKHIQSIAQEAKQILFQAAKARHVK